MVLVVIILCCDVFGLPAGYFFLHSWHIISNQTQLSELIKNRVVQDCYSSIPTVMLQFLELQSDFLQFIAQHCSVYYILLCGNLQQYNQTARISSNHLAYVSFYRQYNWCSHFTALFNCSILILCCDFKFSEVLTTSQPWLIWNVKCFSPFDNTLQNSDI